MGNGLAAEDDFCSTSWRPKPLTVLAVTGTTSVIVSLALITSLHVRSNVYLNVSMIFFTFSTSLH